MERRDFIAGGAGLLGLAGLALAGANSGLLQKKPDLPTVPYSYIVHTDGNGNFFADSTRNKSESFSGKSFPIVFQNCLNFYATLPSPGLIFVKAGDYPMGSLSPSITIPGSFVTGLAQGKGWGIIGEGCSTRGKGGTRFMSGANDQTLFQWGGGATSVPIDFILKDFCCNTNGFLTSVGGSPAIDLSGTETSTLGSYIDNVGFTNPTPNVGGGSFDTCLKIDGCEDLTVRGFKADNNCYHTNALSWNVGLGGNMNLLESLIYSSDTGNGGVGIIGNCYNGAIRNTTLFCGFKFSGALGKAILFDNIYWVLNSAVPNIDGNNFSHLAPVTLQNCFVRTGSLNVFQTGTGLFSFIGLYNSFFDTIVSGGFTDTIANLGTKSLYQRGCRGTYTLRNPFTISNDILNGGGRNSFQEPGYLTTTPAFPATGVFVRNTNGYSVRIFFLTAGAITSIQLKDSNNVNPQTITTVVTPTEITLGVRESIAINFTLAPTWVWYGIQP